MIMHSRQNRTPVIFLFRWRQCTETALMPRQLQFCSNKMEKGVRCCVMLMLLVLTPLPAALFVPPGGWVGGTHRGGSLESDQRFYHFIWVSISEIFNRTHQFKIKPYWFQPSGLMLSEGRVIGEDERTESATAAVIPSRSKERINIYYWNYNAQDFDPQLTTLLYPKKFLARTND